MRTAEPIIRKAFLMICVLPVIGFIALLIYSLWSDSRFALVSPIVAGLEGDIAGAKAEFQRKVGSKFPVGSPGSRLRDGLTSQGFTPPPPTRTHCGSLPLLISYVAPPTCSRIRGEVH
jgi:hypothetical protein